MSETIFNSRIKMKSDTTANWNNATSFIPLQGEIIVYTDYTTQSSVNIPNFKIGDGLAYVVDLPFVNADLQLQLTVHMQNSTIHVTAQERDFWNNKLNCANNIIDETLVLNRL